MFGTFICVTVNVPKTLVNHITYLSGSEYAFINKVFINVARKTTSLIFNFDARIANRENTQYWQWQHNRSGKNDLVGIRHQYREIDGLSVCSLTTKRHKGAAEITENVNNYRLRRYNAILLFIRAQQVDLPPVVRLVLIFVEFYTI